MSSTVQGGGKRRAGMAISLKCTLNFNERVQLQHERRYFGLPFRGNHLMQARVSRFVSDEAAVTAIEYGLVASLISMVIIGAASVIGTNLAAIFTTISIQLAAAA
jgi:pilus assembly protein Flp/PilA